MEPRFDLDSVTPKPSLLTTVLDCLCFTQAHPCVIRGQKTSDNFLLYSYVQLLKCHVLHTVQRSRDPLYREEARNAWVEKDLMFPFHSAGQDLKGKSLVSGVTSF